MRLTRDEIEDVRSRLQRLSPYNDPIENEYLQARFMALCDTALHSAIDLDDCAHRWEKDGIVSRCAKCRAIA